MPKLRENVNNENQLNNDAANNNQPENIDVNAAGNNNQQELNNANPDVIQENIPVNDAANVGADAEQPNNQQPNNQQPNDQQPQEEKEDSLPEGNYDDYRDINDLETLRTKEMNKASIKRAREILGFSNPDITDLRKKQHMVSGDAEINEAFDAAHFHKQGEPRHYGVFVAYMMGTKGFTFNQVMDLKSDSPEFNNYVTEFHDFLKAHPTNVNNVETKKTNVKLWTRIFMNSNKKLGETRMPDIDYSDPKQVQEHANFFYELQSAEIDVAQEFEMVTKSDDTIIYAQEEAGGSKQYLSAIDNWVGIQPRLIQIQNSYSPALFTPENIWENNMNVFDLSVKGRMQLSKIHQNDIKGRTIEDIAADTKKGKSAARSMYSIMASSQFKMPKKINRAAYLTGKDKSAENEFEKLYNASLKIGRQSFNSTTFEGSTKAFAEEIVEYGVAQRRNDANVIPQIFGGYPHESSPEEMLNTIKSEEFREYHEKLVKAYNIMTKELYMPEFYAYIGIEDPLSIIKIDGKSVTDIYAEKYAGIADPDDKMLLIMNEVFKEAIYGDKKITADVYVLDDNDKAIKFKPQIISKPAADICKEMAFYSEVNDLHTQLKELYDTLKATQDDPELDVTIKKDSEGSESYKDFMRALKTAVHCTTLEGESMNSNISTLPQIMVDLKKAAKAYHEKHTGLKGLFKGYSKEKGIPRNNIAKKLMNDEYDFSFSVKNIGDLYPLIGARNADCFDPGLTKTDLQSSWKHLKKSAESKAIPASIETFGNPDPVTERTLEEVHKRDELRRAVADAVKKKGMNLEFLDNAFEAKPTEYARKYLKNKYEKAIKTAGKKEYALSLGDLSSDIMSEDFQDRFNAEVVKLASNPQFSRLVKKDPAHCIEKWEKLMDKGDLGRHEMLAEQSDVYKRLAAADPKNARARWNKAEDVVDGWRREWKREDKKLQELKALINDTDSNALFDPTAFGHDFVKENAYKTLGDIITLSTIKDYIEAKNEEAAVELALHPEEVQNIRTWIIDGLKKDNVLGDRETAAEKINNLKALKIKAIDDVHAADSVKERNSVGPVNKIVNELEKNIPTRPRAKSVTNKKVL
ncbi:MAG: hypothetical protein K5750_03795 [Eubacterium sp.]|nr:hypothetical protein [Eubacterium sp.]